MSLNYQLFMIQTVQSIENVLVLLCCLILILILINLFTLTVIVNPYSDLFISSISAAKCWHYVHWLNVRNFCLAPFVNPIPVEAAETIAPAWSQ